VKLTTVASEIELTRSIVRNAILDIQTLEGFWPPSKRGSNAQRALDSLKARLETAERCASDALAALAEGEQP